MHPSQDYPCPQCHAPLALRRGLVFAPVRCPACGGEVRARTTIARFELHESVARSGLAMVFRALDTATGAELALKLIQPPEVVEPEDFEDFECAMRALEELQHPHIARLIAWGVEDGLPYLVTEWRAASSLATRLAARGRLSEAETLELAVQAASALAAANAAGLTHRDLEPNNLLFTDAGTVQIADFGQAIFYERTADHVGIVWGRPCIVAPERLRHQPEDARSDIYALGALLFNALTGTLPHDGEPHGQLMIELLESESLRVETLVRPLHDKTAAVLNRMLAGERADRFRTWEEVLEQLSQARAETAQPQAPRPAESSVPRRWITIGLLAALVGVVAYFGWDKWLRPATPPPIAEATPAPARPVAK